MNRTIVRTVAIAAAAAMLLCACGKKQEKPVDFASTWEKIDDGSQGAGGNAAVSADDGASGMNGGGTAEGQSQNGTAAGAAADGSNTGAANDAAGTGDGSEASGNDGGTASGEFSYASLKDLEFMFASGAGGWCTWMRVNPDGTFTGNFHDSEMGEMGEDYPNGTIYYCDFRGSFGDLTKVDDYTYKTRLKSLTYDKTPETEEIMDDVRYCYSTAYGLEVTEDLYFYLPGKPLDELPEVFFAWVREAEETAENGRITLYAFYNETQEYAFGSYPAYDGGSGAASSDPGNAAASGSSAGADGAGNASGEDGSGDGESSLPAALSADVLRSHVEETQKASDDLEYRLENEDMNQMELNDTSAELYLLWDDQLNEIWSYLRGSLPEDEMKKLTDEQMKWINSKESEIAAEGAKYEGGSIRPLVEHRLAADLTRDRVYELMEHVK